MSASTPVQDRSEDPTCSVVIITVKVIGVRKNTHSRPPRERDSGSFVDTTPTSRRKTLPLLRTYSTIPSARRRATMDVTLQPVPGKHAPLPGAPYCTMYIPTYITINLFNLNLE